MPRAAPRLWTQEENLVLIKAYKANHTPKELVQIMISAGYNRTHSMIKSRLHLIGLSGKQDTPLEEAIAESNRRIMENAHAARRVGAGNGERLWLAKEEDPLCNIPMQCMCCQESFLSWDKRKNRLCGACRAPDTTVFDYEDAYTLGHA